MLGLCAKAGKLVSGMDATLDNVKRDKVKLILVAPEASEKTKKEMRFISDKFNIPLIIFGNIEDNSHAIGKKNRAIIAICDERICV
jgi:ribosomal protein L7Ae-like RNA K-turn-binding protein